AGRVTGGFAILAGFQGADGGHYATASMARSISHDHSAYSAALTSHDSPTIQTRRSPPMSTLQSPRACRAHQTPAWAEEGWITREPHRADRGCGPPPGSF